MERFQDGTDRQPIELPDFTLSGKILFDRTKAGSTRQAADIFQMSLVDTATNRVVWEDQKTIVKQGSQNQVGSERSRAVSARRSVLGHRLPGRPSKACMPCRSIGRAWPGFGNPDACSVSKWLSRHPIGAQSGSWPPPDPPPGAVARRPLAARRCRPRPRDLRQLRESAVASDRCHARWCGARRLQHRGWVLEVFDLVGGLPQRRGAVAVGVDPVSVRVRGNGEAWVVNQISDSVSVVDLASMRARSHGRGRRAG
jgi:hypothetical protein